MKADTEQADEFYAERVAIMEFDGGMPRDQAEYLAAVATYRWCWSTRRDWPADAGYERIANDLSRDLVEILSTEEADTRYYYRNFQ